MKLPETGSLPPHNLEVEQARLGAAMLDPTGETSRSLDARWFYDKSHDKLARRMRTLVEGGKIPDFLVLSPIVAAEGWFKDNGGTQYLIECQSLCPSVANVPSWDRTLFELYQARQVIRLCATVEQHAREHSGESSETVRLLSEGIKDLEQREQVAIEAGPVMALQRLRHDDPCELLKDRYLCRGGALLLTGPTGIGKSSLSMQAMFSWALGRELFGITPAQPLKSLLIQAENDDGDLAETRDGVLRGLNVSDEEREFLKSQILTFNENRRTGIAFCAEVLGPLLKKHQPDLVWIDPVLAYLGGDTSAQGDVGPFLRNGVAPLLIEFKCAAVLVHHTNKPPSGREKPDWKAGDLAYLGSGSAEWANWPRAGLAIRSKGSPTEFELAAGKRGGRIGWLDSTGRKIWQRNIQHAQDGSICWILAPDDDPAMTKQGRPKKADHNDILELLSPVGLTTEEWKNEASSEAGVSRSSFFAHKKLLKTEGRIHFSKITNKWQPVTPRTAPVQKVQEVQKPIYGHAESRVQKVHSPLGVDSFLDLPAAGVSNGAEGRSSVEARTPELSEGALPPTKSEECSILI